MNKPIYLDYNATTPVDPRVLEAMLPFLKENFGNPSSLNHSYGTDACQALNHARKQVSDLIRCQPQEVIWTSGATESNNLALQSIARNHLRAKEPIHIVTSLIEHKAVLDVAKSLEKDGVEVTYLKPDRFGLVSAESVALALKPHTRLISIIMGQNEIGTINPIAEIGALAAQHKILFHVDGAQSVGKVAIDVAQMNIDLLSASGHKLYAPKGVGFLYVKNNIALEPIFFGGKQEKCIRPGTPNVPGIVAMGLACEICKETMTEEVLRQSKLRDFCIEKILGARSSAVLNGHPTQRLCTNASFSFPDIAPEAFDLYLGDLAISSGSACNTGDISHVLKAIGHTEQMARSTVRIGIGRFTTMQDIEIACSKILNMLAKKSSQKDRVVL